MNKRPYPLFSGHDSICPKCGKGRLGVEYQPGGSMFHSPGIIMHAVGQSEWMLRRCIECGFECPEMCIDTPHWSKAPMTAIMKPSNGSAQP